MTWRPPYAVHLRTRLFTTQCLCADRDTSLVRTLIAISTADDGSDAASYRHRACLGRDVIQRARSLSPIILAISFELVDDGSLASDIRSVLSINSTGF